MADISLIPQNRIKDLSTTFDGCVHTTGNETIAGNKTFSGITTFTTTPYVYKANTSELILKSSTADTTVTPESNYQVGHYVIADKNTKIGGYWYCEKRNDGGIRNSLETRKYSDDGSSYNHSALQVWRNKYDEGYLDFGSSGTNLSVSGVDSSTTSTMVPTKGWVNNPETSTNVVHRSGNENIAGNKTFKNNISINTENENHSEIKLYATKFSTNDTSLDETSFGGKVFIYDKNNNNFGVMEAGKLTNGNNFIQWNLRNRTDESWTPNGGVVRLLTNDTESFFDFPKCTTNATTSSTAANNKVAVVVQNYKSGTSWYRVWSDGWIEQGGRVSISQDTQTTITLLKPFSDTNYTVLITANRSGTQTAGDGNFTVEYVSTSQFKWSNGDDFSGNGIWYACGY